MKFSKYNNPSKRRKISKPHHQTAYQQEMRNQLDALLAKCETPEQRDMLIKAYSITIKP